VVFFILLNSIILFKDPLHLQLILPRQGLQFFLLD
jgi:hypothetical protein